MTQSGVAVDGQGNVYIADYGSDRVRKVDAAGTITTFAGTGTYGYSGDGGPATNGRTELPVKAWRWTARATSTSPTTRNHRVRKVDAAGTITTLAGTGEEGYGGDGGPAASAKLNSPSGVAVDGQGNVYIADAGTTACARWTRRARSRDSSTLETCVGREGWRWMG